VRAPAAAGLGAAETGALRGRVHQDVLLAFLSVAGFEAWTRLDPARAAAGRGARARETLEGRYWLDATGEYAYGIAADGAPLGERTAWPAAGLALVDVAPGRARRACERLASSGLMSDWGARFLSRESALYDPVSYNNGAVWPFLSGYASLACYRAGHALAGWGYLRGTAHLATLAANGCVPELLSGEFCRPLDTAVPHQLFSTAVGLLWPAVRGLLGVRVEDDRLVVAPRLPASWKGVTLRHVPFGARRLTLRCARESGRWTLRVEGERGTGPVRVRFDPLLPLGATSPGPAEATIEPPATLTVEHGPGWEVEAPVPLPAPGDRSRGPRVPVCVAEGDGLRLELEGPAGTETALRVGAPGAFRAEGARVAPDGAVVVSFPGGEGPAWRRVPVRLVRER
jgi:hypothetical protein